MNTRLRPWMYLTLIALGLCGPSVYSSSVIPNHPTVEPSVDAADQERPVTMMVDRGEEGDVFFTLQNLKIPQPVRRFPFRAKTLALFWDASEARADLDHKPALDALQRLGRLWQVETVYLTIMNQSDEPLRFDLKGGRMPHLIDHLRALEYQGASDLATLSGDNYDVDAMIFVGSGQQHVDKPPRLDYQVPWFVLALGDQLNMHLMDHLIHKSGGRLLDLNQMNAKAAVNDAVKGYPEPLQVAFDPTWVRDIMVVPGDEEGSFTLTGILKSEKATVTLGYATGLRMTVPLLVSSGRWANGQARDFWARTRLLDLAAFPRSYRGDIEDIEETYRVFLPEAETRKVKTTE